MLGMVLGMPMLPILTLGNTGKPRSALGKRLEW